MVGVGMLVIVLAIGIVLFWPRGQTGNTRIELSGVRGTPFTGFYIQQGRRVPVSAVLPWTFHGADITGFEFRKASPADTLRYEVIRDSSAGGHSELSGSIVPGVPGLHGRIGFRSISIGPSAAGIGI